MEFHCDRCSTRYSTSQALREGHTYRYRCRACGGTVLVSVPAATPRALGGAAPEPTGSGVLASTRQASAAQAAPAPTPPPLPHGEGQTTVIHPTDLPPPKDGYVDLILEDDAPRTPGTPIDLGLSDAPRTPTVPIDLRLSDGSSATPHVPLDLRLFDDAPTTPGRPIDLSTGAAAVTPAPVAKPAAQAAGPRPSASFRPADAPNRGAPSAVTPVPSLPVAERDAQAEEPDEDGATPRWKLTRPQQLAAAAAVFVAVTALALAVGFGIARSGAEQPTVTSAATAARKSARPSADPGATARPAPPPAPRPPPPAAVPTPRLERESSPAQPPATATRAAPPGALAPPPRAEKGSAPKAAPPGPARAAAHPGPRHAATGTARALGARPAPKAPPTAREPARPAAPPANVVRQLQLPSAGPPTATPRDEEQRADAAPAPAAPAPAAAPRKEAAREEQPVVARAGYRIPSPITPRCVEQGIRLPPSVADRLPGSVVLRFAVNRNGTTDLVQTQPGPDRLPGERIEPEIVEALSAAVRGCRFSPGADEQGVPLRMWVVMKVQFAR